MIPKKSESGDIHKISCFYESHVHLFFWDNIDDKNIIVDKKTFNSVCCYNKIWFNLIKNGGT